MLTRFQVLDSKNVIPTALYSLAIDGRSTWGVGICKLWHCKAVILSFDVAYSMVTAQKV